MVSAGSAGGSAGAVAELQAGVAFWRSKLAVGWPADFHNADYQKWGQEPRTFSDAWWVPFRRRLHDWVALRPATYEEVTARFVARRQAIIDAWARHCDPYAGCAITAVSWEQVGPFADLVGEIKPMRGLASPVFTSKFCHFLLPKVFPVVDNEGSGNRWPHYRDYFLRVQDIWRQTPAATQGALVDMMAAEVARSGVGPHPEFPMVNKIVELRLIGRQQMGSGPPPSPPPAPNLPPNPPAAATAP
ncbi:MAG: hypothetical protein M0Z82_17700 [Actinomycetota bacterium]|jgi:hypothetical protein|nr:hypothetical protein [Actinomycetota bacterium]